MTVRSTTSIVFIAAVVVVLARPWAARADCTAPRVSTTSGVYCGSADRSEGKAEVFAYLGVPYAETTAGLNRWAPPVPAAQRPGVTEAIAFGPSCPQHIEAPPEGYERSEDCLSLNVWTPAQTEADPKESLPVMVFIYGGAFVGGNSANPVYRGARLAAAGRVVVVSLNYRLGALGFLAGIDGLSGNYGFMDQQVALRWVRDNIHEFGGDPNKVTIFGESAGAMSVGLHLVSPGSRGLFRGAIMESNPYGIPYKSVDAAAKFANTVRDRLGCREAGVACMREKSFEDVVHHQESTLLEIKGLFSGLAGFLAWAPVVDGTVIPIQPFEASISIPTIVGTNSNEGLLFAALFQLHRKTGPRIPKAEYGLAIDLEFKRKAKRKIKRNARYKPRRGDNTDTLSRLLTDYLFTCANRRVMERSEAPVFAYQFTHVPSFPIWPNVPLCDPSRDVVCHAAELPFVFGNAHAVHFAADEDNARFTATERRLSEEMVGYWTRFAEHLDPNAEQGRTWPEFEASDPLRLILNTTLSERSDLEADCRFWDGL
ncbi:MAG: carboxylesterase family protein [Myxococcota bacterium]